MSTVEIAARSAPVDTWQKPLVQAQAAMVMSTTYTHNDPQVGAGSSAFEL